MPDIIINQQITMQLREFERDTEEIGIWDLGLELESGCYTIIIMKPCRKLKKEGEEHSNSERKDKVGSVCRNKLLRKLKYFQIHNPHTLLFLFLSSLIFANFDTLTAFALLKT